jgi:hypothetical protein
VLLRDNAGWVLAGLIVAAVVLGAGACGGDGQSTESTSEGSISFRPAPGVVTPISSGPCDWRPWINVKGILICVPTGATSSLLFVDPPVGSQYAGDLHFYVIRRGDSEVRIGTESGEITKWDVAPEDEEEFRRLIREPLEEAGY